MDCMKQYQAGLKVKPRLILHGGAGNVNRSTLTPELWEEYRHALLRIVWRAHAYMTTPVEKDEKIRSSADTRVPSALQVATHAVSLLEDDHLFNAGHGAVFTRDGINELEASVMVTKGHKKRAVALSGIRTVRNPIQLAKAMLEAGEDDLECAGATASNGTRGTGDDCSRGVPDVPSAQQHTHLFGPDVTESLARKYGLPIVDPSYCFTQRRWDEHIRALEREKREGKGSGIEATYSDDEYLPQGTVGAVALDEDGVICVATSTGGLTNKLTGRVGDTPTVGAGFWAEEWEDEPIDDARNGNWERRIRSTINDNDTTPGLILTDGLRSLLAECLPWPTQYRPLSPDRYRPMVVTTRRSFATSGTGNGDSFLRVAAARTAAARARWKREPSGEALTAVAGPGGELQRSAGDRWGRTGEGQGGMIGIELAVDRDHDGNITGVRSELLQDFNCGGMFRAWIDDEGKAHARAFREE